MTDIETRLREALAARAELVAPEGLARQAPVREAPPPWWRRPGPALLAAAAVLLVCVPVGVLMVTSGDGPDRNVPPAASPSPTQTPSEGVPDRPESLPAEWGTAPEQQPGASWVSDFDGDGRDDRASATAATGLTVETARGTLTAPVDGASVSIGGVVMLAGSPTPVITVQATSGAAGTTYIDWHLFVVRDGALVELAPSDRGPYLGNQLSNLTTEEGGRDTWETWQTPDVGGVGEIYTMRYLDGGTAVPDGDYPGAGDLLFRAAFYRWVIDGDRLRPQRLGVACVAPPSVKVYDCP